MTGLEEDASYEFRVRAANAAGVGMASMASDSMCAKAVEGKVKSQSTQCTVHTMHSTQYTVRGLVQSLKDSLLIL